MQPTWLITADACFYSSQVLLTVCEKLISMNEDEKTTLNFIYDYLGSRLKIMNMIDVSKAL